MAAILGSKNRSQLLRSTKREINQTPGQSYWTITLFLIECNWGWLPQKLSFNHICLFVRIFLSQNPLSTKSITEDHFRQKNLWLHKNYLYHKIHWRLDTGVIMSSNDKVQFKITLNLVGLQIGQLWRWWGQLNRPKPLNLVKNDFPCLKIVCGCPSGLPIIPNLFHNIILYNLSVEDGWIWPSQKYSSKKWSHIIERYTFLPSW